MPRAHLTIFTVSRQQFSLRNYGCNLWDVFLFCGKPIYMNKILRLVIFFTAFVLYLMLLEGSKEPGNGADHKTAGIADARSAVSPSLVK